MKTVALLLVLVAAVCLVEGRAAEAPVGAIVAPKAPLAVDFKQLESVEGLSKERLEKFRQALEAFKNKIDDTRMNSAHREAIKQQAMERVAQRIAQMKQKTPKEV